MSLSVIAAPLSPDEALRRAQADGPRRVMQKGGESLTLAFTATTELGTPSLYVFNRPAGEGFMILSADDVAYPVLGYTDSGSFSEENISPAMKWWLGEYTRQIAYGAEAPAMKSPSSPAYVEGAAIAPLLTSKWDQGNPYNAQCPTVGNARTVTGCVATAMAQVMRYHEYPAKGTGMVSATCAGTSDEITLDLAKESFDWANMLDSYEGEYNDTQKNAVAYLMKACGYSVHMDYSTSESGAISFNVGKALIENFGYNNNITFESRKYYSTPDWEAMVYNELAAKRPVYYAGQSEGGGHAFVCDGYDGKGYFHINWGWGGMSDGYFLLQSLNPDALGIGGGMGGGFSFEQSIVKDVQPDAQGTTFIPRLSIDSNITGNRSSTQKIAVRFQGENGGFWNLNYTPLTVNIGVIVEPLDGQNVEKTMVTAYTTSQNREFTLSDIELNMRSGFKNISFPFPITFPDGRYKVTLASQDATAENAEWIPMLAPQDCYNSFTVTKAGSKYNLEFLPMKSLSVVDVNILSEFHFGSMAKVGITLTNNTDTELTQTLAPALMKQGEYQFIGSEIPFTLKPGETVTREFVSEFIPQNSQVNVEKPTSYLMKIVNADSGKALSFSKYVTMDPPSPASIYLRDARIVGGQKTDVEGKEGYLVPDPTAIEFNVDVECVEGFFGLPLYAGLFEMDGGNSLVMQPLTPAIVLGADSTATVGTTMYYEQPGNYFIASFYYANGSLNQVSQSGAICRITISDPASVDGIEADAEGTLAFDRQTLTARASAGAGVAAMKVTNLSGTDAGAVMTAEGETGVISLAGLPKGIYVVSATFADGTVRSIKVAL